MDTKKNNIVVLGLGNLLMGDEGFGVHVVQQLQRYYDCDGVEIIDGGTKGIHLLGCLNGATRLLIVDAVDCGLSPGEVILLNGDEIPSSTRRKVSPHQMELGDLLSIAAMSGLRFDEIALVGIQPASMELSTELSPVVAARMDDAIEKIVAQLCEWGLSVTRKGETCTTHSAYKTC